MLENRYCPIFKSEVILRYHAPDRHYRIEKGKIVRDDAHQGGIWDSPELNFICSNDSEHKIPAYDKWEDPITEFFYQGAYYDK